MSGESAERRVLPCFLCSLGVSELELGFFLHFSAHVGEFGLSVFALLFAFSSSGYS